MNGDIESRIHQLAALNDDARCIVAELLDEGIPTGHEARLDFTYLRQSYNANQKIINRRLKGRRRD